MKTQSTHGELTKCVNPLYKIYTKIFEHINKFIICLEKGHKLIHVILLTLHSNQGTLEHQIVP